MPLWLNSGVPATEVARRAGHGVAVLLKIYAPRIDGQADAANKRITDPPVPFTDPLRLAVAAYPARFKAPPASTPHRISAVPGLVHRALPGPR